jgi:hypothetical protein
MSELRIRSSVARAVHKGRVMLKKTENPNLRTGAPPMTLRAETPILEAHSDGISRDRVASRDAGGRFARQSLVQTLDRIPPLCASIRIALCPVPALEGHN